MDSPVVNMKSVGYCWKKRGQTYDRTDLVGVWRYILSLLAKVVTLI